MQRALARLRHADREVLVLHYLQALPIAEVAALLRCGKNALEQRLSRARTRLRAELEAAP
jgi:RNA polymerase sigma-70 factor (ECF subfamily)